jgi:hypothetical protein
MNNEQQGMNDAFFNANCSLRIPGGNPHRRRMTVATMRGMKSG